MSVKIVSKNLFVIYHKLSIMNVHLVIKLEIVLKSLLIPKTYSILLTLMEIYKSPSTMMLILNTMPLLLLDMIPTTTES
jgi:hypothetical protein